MLRSALAALFFFVFVCACSDPDPDPDPGPQDSAQLDRGVVDTGAASDSGALDTGEADSGVVDTGEADSGEVDTGVADTGEADTGEVDAGVADTGEVDTGEVDSGEVDAGGPTLCGNGVLDRGEECDDGNTIDDGNGCSAACANNAVCGNGIVESLFESCDPGLQLCCNATCDAPAAIGTTCRAAVDECDADELCDGMTLDCPGDVTLADGTACTSCPAAVDCAGCYAGSCADSRYFCADILARGLSTGDGVYVIHPAATASISASTSTISVFCDMTTNGGGWTMVYKKSRLVAGDAGSLWSAGALNAGDLTLLDRAISGADYNNALHQLAWGAFTEARIEVVATGTTATKFIEFNLVGTTPTSWFAADRHTSASWTDLPTSATFDNGGAQAFRIGSGRSFYINRLWGSCPLDRGWLQISTIDFCYWEQATGDPADIMYSPGALEASVPNEFDFADTFVVFVR